MKDQPHLILILAFMACIALLRSINTLSLLVHLQSQLAPLMHFIKQERTKSSQLLDAGQTLLYPQKLIAIPVKRRSL